MTRSVSSGFFFSFEGIDGSGKSTQARLLADALREYGYDVVEVREPGGTELGESVRALLLNPDAQIDATAELLLFSAARAQLVEAVVRPALQEGAIVIADRFIDSSTAYQGAGRQLATPDWMDSFHDFVTSGVRPDRTYLIDVPLATALARRNGLSADRMEQSGVEFYGRVQACYQRLSIDYLDRVICLDGERKAAEVHSSILEDALDKLTGYRKGLTANRQ